jgi:hypothetical protein
MNANKAQELTTIQEEILTCISKHISSPTDISKKINKSLPLIVNQIQLLEAKQYIEKEEVKKLKKAGRPKQKYSIKKSQTSIQIIHPHNYSTQKITNNKIELYLQLLIHIPSNQQPLFSKYFWEKAQYFKHVEIIATLNHTEKEVELLAITSKEHLEKLRKEISNVNTTYEQITTRFACWVHTLEEIEEGLKNNDEYYQELLKKIQHKIDNKKQLSQIEEKLMNKKNK